MANEIRETIVIIAVIVATVLLFVAVGQAADVPPNDAGDKIGQTQIEKIEKKVYEQRNCIFNLFRRPEIEIPIPIFSQPQPLLIPRQPLIIEQPPLVIPQQPLVVQGGYDIFWTQPQPPLWLWYYGL